MESRSRRETLTPNGLLRIEDCLDATGDVVLPPDATLVSLIDRNAAHAGDLVAYRYLDHSRSVDGEASEVTWSQFATRLRAVAARLQQITTRGDRAAILAPQGLDYVVAMYAAVKAGTIAVPLFAPELPGHAERLDTALRDAEPTAILTTTAATPIVEEFLRDRPLTGRPEMIAVNEIPDAAAEAFIPVELGMDDVSHLQYTSGSTRPPVGVEITHRAVGTNLVQMILSIDLLDRNTHGLSWLPLYHDMGLSMIGFPAVYGGHCTLMSPTAFIRRPQRWIYALAAESRLGRVVTAAPNFAYEWTAQRGLPTQGHDVDLSNVVMIIGSEPVSIDSIKTFEKAFGPYGLPHTAFKPSYGIAEATLFVATVEPTGEATVARFHRRRLGAGQVVPVTADDPDAVPHVSCGTVARSLYVVIVDPDTGEELTDERVGEIWLQGNNVGRGYWNRPAETRRTFGGKLNFRLPQGSHADGADIGAAWLRTGDLGAYVGGELYVFGRLADLVVIDGRSHYPHDIEATAAEASPIVRRGYAAAFCAPANELPGSDADDTAERLVIVAERAAGTVRADPAPAIAAIRTAVADRHGVDVADVLLLPAGSISRTTSGKVARRACRTQYLAGSMSGH